MYDIERIYTDLEQMNYEIATESRLNRVGLKDTQDIDSILKKYEYLYTDETIEFVSKKRKEVTDPAEKENLERLYYTLLGSNMYSHIAKLSDELQVKLANASVKYKDKEIPYFALHGMIQKEPSFDEREALSALSEEVHVRFTADKQALLREDLKLLNEKTGLNYITYYEQQKLMKYGEFAANLKASMERLRPLYIDVMTKWAKKKLDRPFENISKAHVSFLMKGGQFDKYFPVGGMVDRLKESLLKMDIDFRDYPNILIDLEERAKKNPRACCYGAKVPQEIHLILKPFGGLTDYDTFLHEGGHALHYGSVDEQLSYPLRELSRDHSLTETYAFLLQNLTLEPQWLTSMGVPAEVAQQIRYEKVISDLYMYTRYTAKFVSELEFFGQKDITNGNIYADTLTKYTGFVYKPTSYLFDMDEGFYSADYLRAWLAEAQLSHFLKKDFGANWWENPESGHFLRSLWAKGTQPVVEQLMESFGYKPFDTHVLEERFGELKEFLA